MKNLLEKPKLSTSGVGPDLSTSPISSETQSKRIENTSVLLSPLYEIYETVKTDIQSRGTEPKYKTGLRGLDNLLWGVHKKEMLTIGARTSQGKSAFAVQLAMNLADTCKRVIYFSLEMTKEQILERLFCNVCCIDNVLLRQGQQKKEAMDNDATFRDWIKDAKLLIDDKSGYYFNKIIEVCDIIKPDFVIIDYIQMIATRGFKSKLEAIEEYVRRLKQLSSENDFGVILISQVNRGGIDNPNMSHYKWAGVLEEHSDTCLTLKWDWEKDEYIVSIDKQRHGTVGEVKLRFLPQFSRFEDLPY